MSPSELPSVHGKRFKAVFSALLTTFATLVLTLQKT